MSDINVLEQLLIVLTATLAIVFLFQKLRLPPIVGFLLAGIIIGPDGTALIQSGDQVEALAQVGVVLLLFTIGLEFSLSQLLPLRLTMIGAGILQIVLTTLAVAVASLWSGEPLRVGLFNGFLVSLSSTAIVLKIYSERREVHSLQGRLATGILLFQDLCIVPMVLLIPVLAQSTSASWPLVGWALVKALLFLSAIVLGARFLLPRLLRQVALLKNRELLMLLVVSVCLGTAWLTAQAGLSLALGAFIAGLVISESEFSHQIIADVLPLRDCFSGIFFISIGMLLDLDFLARDFTGALINLLWVVGIKAAVIVLVIGALYRSLRLGVALGMSLAQVGEFSFILADIGRGYGLLGPTQEQPFLAAAILSMIATPFLIQSARRWSFGLEKLAGLPPGKGAGPEKGGSEPDAGHVIVVGYGLNGQNLARVLKEVGIPYRILDMDPDAVRRARAAGEPISFGDGTRPELLAAVAIDRARVLVIAISDPAATAYMVSQARRLRPDLHVIVRTRYLAEIEHLYRLGANQVIPEEFETSVEIFARVLQEYHLPRNVISLQVDLIRKEHYGTLRGLRFEGKRLDELSQFLTGTTTDTLLILEDSPAAGQELEKLDLRSRSGVTVIAVVRAGQSIHNPGPGFRLAVGDILVLLGSHKELDEAALLLTPQGQSEEGGGRD